MSACLSSSELEDLVAGRLCDERHAALDEHVQNCASCQAALEALDEPQDAFFSAVRELASLAVSSASRPLERAIGRLKSLQSARDLPFSANAKDALLDSTLGDFRIVRQVARGGMGIVYEARQISLGRRVALKTLAFAGSLDARRMQRFQNESRAAASLEHTHIVPVYAVGSDRGVYFYAMRFIDGPNLAEIIKQLRDDRISPATDLSRRAGETAAPLASEATIRDRLSPLAIEVTRSGERPDPVTGNVRLGEAAWSVPTLADADPAIGSNAINSLVGARGPRDIRTRLDSQYIRSVVRLVIEAARALDYAHERGVLHRDIKPSNLMLDSDGVLWITDFGLARIETDPTFSATGEVLGTLRYMSPEQALGKRGMVDHRGDIYSLGVTLYELLTLTFLFADVPDHVVLAKIASEDPPAPRQLNPSIPVDLETIVLKAMSKEPGERYATAEEFAADLECFGEGKKIKAQRRGLADRLARWLRRHPAGLAVAATAMIALLVIAVGFATYSASLRRTVRERDDSNSQLAAANIETANALGESKEARDRADRALKESRQQAYDQDIEYAARAIAAEDVSQASNLLDRCFPRSGESDLRGFDWYWLRGRLSGTGRTLRVSQKPVYDAEFSPDGLRLATGGADGILRVYDTKTGREILRVPTGQVEINATVFAPDGKTIATSGDDATIRFWGALDGKSGLRISGPKGRHAFSVLFTPSGGQIVTTCHDPGIRIFNTQTGALEVELKDSKDAVNQIALAPDGKTLASGSDDGAARLWDLATRRCLRVFAMNEGRCLAITLSPDAKLLAAGYYGRTVRVWKCSDGTTALAGRLRDTMHDVCFLPSGDGILAADNAGSIRKWKVPQNFAPPPTTSQPTLSSIRDGESDQSVARWQRHVGAIHRIVVDPAGNTMASAGNDGTVSLTELRSAVEAHRVELKDNPEAEELVRQSSQFRFGRNDELLYTDRTVPGSSFTGGNAYVRNLETGRVEHWNRDAANGISGMALTPDGTAVLLGHERAAITIRYRTRRDGNTWGLTGKDDVEQMDFLPDGRTLIVRLGRDETDRLRFYDFPTRKRLDQYPPRLADNPSVVSLSGRWLVTQAQLIGTVWDLQSQPFATRDFPFSNDILALAVAPDDSLFASGGNDRKIALRSLPTGAVQKELIGHEAFVTSLAFSPDGRSLLSGDLAGTIKVWNVRTGRFLFDLAHLERKIERIGFSPSGRYLAYSAYHGPFPVYDVRALQTGDQILPQPAAMPDRGL
jgi:eukaryotic-like serine/threonine-protein kinase